MKRYVCGCGWSMPETCIRAITAHQQEHPTDEQRAERNQRASLAKAASAVDGGPALGVIDRFNALRAILSAPPEVLADELFFKPLRRELGRDATREAEHGE